jgi:hypothetical protein
MLTHVSTPPDGLMVSLPAAAVAAAFGLLAPAVAVAVAEVAPVVDAAARLLAELGSPPALVSIVESKSSISDGIAET